MFSRLASSSVVALVAVWTLSSAALGQARNPVGETAAYKIERSSSRTSSMIQSGTMDTEITNAIADHPDGPMYQLVIDYEFRIQFFGTQRGTRDVEVPEVYFTPEFMADLRANGEYVGPTFKVRHLGYADARTMDGGFYPNCDKIFIYDIDQTANASMISLARTLLAPGADAPDFGDEIEDLEITAHVAQGLPVLGAAKIDIKGKYRGQNVKAGADYEAP